ncbi:hypothetical protein ACFRCI_19185 [Streptomyces sp. NPDC056638]|uniref:hypothetical protein n=1 Tax=Streptomyces sp. NPDC056638 TaxID=3345887 RepID=UPI0036AEC0F2
MPSVIGLLEEREAIARQRMESLPGEMDRLVAELRDAEAAQERPLIAEETVSQVLSESSKPDDVGVSGDARRPCPDRRCPVRWRRCGGKGWT